MVKKAFFSLIATAVLIGAPVLAAESAAEQKVSDRVSTHAFLRQMFGKMQAKIIVSRDMGSIEEVVFEQQGRKGVLYLTQDGKHVLFGNAMDEKGRNITRERMEALNRVDFANIPLDDALIIKRGNGAKRLVMVTDVDCPYCKKAYKWLEGQDNYTLYVFLYPLDQLHPQAREKSVKVLCSSDRAKALKDAKEGKSLQSERCSAGEALLAKHVLAGQVLGLNGTPLFVLADGRKVEGMNQAILEGYLKGTKELAEVRK